MFRPLWCLAAQRKGLVINMKKNMKRIAALFLTATIAASLCMTASAAQSVTITLDGKVIETAAYVDRNDRTQAPVAAAEALGITVSAEGSAITCKKGGVSVSFNGSWAGETSMDTETVEGYVPIAYLASAFGYGIQWDGSTKTVALTSASYPYHQGIEQNTRYGRISGFEKDGSLHWFGVPYAKTPVGELRWKAPQPVKPWEGVLQATESKPGSQTASVQASKDTAGNGTVVASTKLMGSEEGAVSLDITRPNTAETGLPVFFYIHGGNNQTGSSSAFPATQFAQETNCVVVSVNHRLGLLGFNALPALKHGTPEENSGNFTMLDLAAALDWLAENAETFGGDPNNITVTGSSAGGRDVMAMLISPIFEGKFQKAISYSGGMTTAEVEPSQRVEARALAPLAVKKGVQTDEAAAAEWLLTDGDDVRKFLYSLSDEELAAAFGGAAIRMSAFPHLFTDGVVLPKEGFDTRNYNEVPVMMVNGDREFSTFCKSSAPFKAPSVSELMKDEILLPQYKFAEKYGSMMYGYFNGEESANRMLNNYSSPIYTCTIRWGDDPAVVGEEYATIYGSYHCMTTPLMTHIVTNASASYPELYASPSCKNVSTMLNSYYKNFLWTGSPNGNGLPQWDAWTSLNGSTQLIVNANDESAWAEMSMEHTSYEAILKLMDADETLPAEQKTQMIQKVLNGRWFSAALDEHYNNENLWK